MIINGLDMRRNNLRENEVMLGAKVGIFEELKNFWRGFLLGGGEKGRGGAKKGRAGLTAGSPFVPKKNLLN
jgi:hypothetical protein